MYRLSPKIPILGFLQKFFENRKGWDWTLEGQFKILVVLLLPLCVVRYLLEFLIT